MSVTLRERKRSGGKTTIYIDIYQNGQRRVENTGIHLTGDKVADKERRRMAEVLRTQRELEQHGYRIGVTPDFKRRIDLLGYIESIMKQRIERGTLEAQLSNYKSTCKLIRLFGKGPVEIGEVSIEWLEGFKTFLLHRVTQTTASVYFATLRAVYSRAMKDGIIQQNPFARVDRIARVESQREYLTIEEVQQLSNTECEYPDIKRAFLFSCFTGLRISDIEVLKWEHVVDGQLRFRQKKTGGIVTLPLNETAIHFLGSPSAPGDLVFSLPARTVISYNLSKWAKAAGITKHLTAHVGRHTMATLALTSGVDIYTVSKLLGHRDIGTTQIYAKVVDSKKQAAVNMLPSIQT